MREQLADYAHEAWSGWMIYLFKKSVFNKDGTVTIPKWAVDRWMKQCYDGYYDLSEEEQLSDLKEADKMIAIMERENAKKKNY